MKRRMLVALIVLIVVVPLSARAQEMESRAEPRPHAVSAAGLEVTLQGIENSVRRNKFGQVLLPVGSCPPGVVQGLDLISGTAGQGSVVRLSLAGTPAQVASDLEGPPVVVDIDGEKHEPLRPFFLPDPGALRGLSVAGETLLCEFPFDVDAGNVRAIEFAGVRLDVLPE